MKRQGSYAEWCIGLAKGLAEMLEETERKATLSIEKGTCPYDLPDNADVGELMTGAFLLVLCGMLADEEDGKPLLMRSADRLKEANLVQREEIREACDRVMDTLGAVRTTHRWN